MRRLKDYVRLISKLASWPALIIWWGQCILICARNLRARTLHMPGQGMHVADLPCGFPQCDFSMFWPVGRLVMSGHAAGSYDPNVLQALRALLFFPNIELLPWVYPPPTLLLVAPLAWLNFETAFWVWSMALTVLAIALLRIAGLGWAVIALGLLCPAALWNLQVAQLGTITGALLVAGLLLAATRPRIAGICLGLLIIKPQPGLLAPVALAASRHWRAFAAAGCMTMLLVLISFAVLGVGAWRAYLGPGTAAAAFILHAPPAMGSGYEQFGVSVFWMLRSCGAGVAVSYVAQAFATITTIVLTWLIWRDRMALAERVAITVFLSLLATPYGFVNDMVAYSIALVTLVRARGWRFDLADVVFWLWPALCPAVYERTGILLTPLVVAALVARTWWQSALRAGAESRLPATGPPGDAMSSGTAR